MSHLCWHRGFHHSTTYLRGTEGIADKRFGSSSDVLGRASDGRYDSWRNHQPHSRARWICYPPPNRWMTHPAGTPRRVRGGARERLLAPIHFEIPPRFLRSDRGPVRERCRASSIADLSYAEPRSYVGLGEVAGNAKAQRRGSWRKQPTEKQCVDAVQESHRAASIEVSWLSLFTFKTQRLPIAYWENSALSPVWKVYVSPSVSKTIW